jgi:hypothetical protein
VQREWFGKKNLIKIVVKKEYRSERSEENIRFINYSRNNRLDLFIKITLEITSEQRIKLNKTSYRDIQFYSIY